MLTPARYITTPGGYGQDQGVWDKAEIENHLTIQFQNGPALVYGVNGVQLIDVLKVCADQARALMSADSSRNRAQVITKLDEAILWEGKRIAEAGSRTKAVDATTRRNA